jgi:nucleotide-binding universal stress UspA family protein
MTNRIIACIDGSASAVAVCDWTAWSSVRMAAPITLLHVLDKPTAVTAPDLSGAIGLGAREDLLEQLTRLDEQREKIALQHGKHLLATARQRVEAAGALDVDTRQRHGHLVETLAELEPETRLLVIGRQGEQSQRHAEQIGSQLESVIRTVHCPVLVALPGFRAPQRFLLAYDGSTTAHTALERVVASQLLQGLTCHLVMVGATQQSRLESAAARLQQAGFATVVKCLPGDDVAALADYADANAIDLLIMGAYGHSRIRRFFIGSNTATLLHRTRVPLLILR